MAYAESESMALKRLKVALKRKDWQMFEYGLSRTIELINSGTTISEIQEWYKVMDTAKKENVPEDLINKMTNIIDSVLSPASTQPLQSGITESPKKDSPAYTSHKMAPIGKVKSPDIPFVIFIDSINTPEQTKAVVELRNTLNNLSINPNTKPDTDFLNTIAKLLKSLDKNSQELSGLETLLAKYPKSGVIIVSGYDSEIIKLLSISEADFSINDIKKATSDKYWKIYPLGGITSIFYCPACGTKTFQKNYSNTVAGICKKCSSAAYPDLYPVDINNPQTNPKTWYLAYQALTSSENWLLITPPNVTERMAISRLLLEACSNAIINNAYIVSNRSEIGTWWRNKLEEMVPSANVAPVCFNVEILLTNYIKFPETQTQP